jgi:hypothetical protein
LTWPFSWCALKWITSPKRRQAIWEEPGMVKRKKTTASGKSRNKHATEPSPIDLIREPDLTAPAVVRFACKCFLKVTHPDYMPHEVMALVKQGQAQFEPIAPGQVGTLILEGFPYTVLGYYTLVEHDAEYERTPAECSFHGPFYDFCRKHGASIDELIDEADEDFDKARHKARKLQEKMARAEEKQRKRRSPRR